MQRVPTSFWHRRRVFVTGCTGFLGTWAVRELLDRGADVIGLVRDRALPSDLFADRLFERITIVRGRVEDRGRLETVFRLYRVQTVLHLAAPADPGPPAARARARWGLEVLEAAARAVRDGELVAAAPTPDPTGRAEAAVKFARQSGYPVGVAGLPRLFGGGDRTWSRLVPGTVRASLTGEPGPSPDAERAAPYLHARDAARACLSLAESLAGDPETYAGRVVPFPGTTTGSELFAALTAALASPTNDDGSVVRGPSPTPLGDAVAETVAWYRRFLLPPESAAADAPELVRSAA